MANASTANDAALRALALASRHVSASVACPVEEEELLAWLRSGSVPAGWREYVRAFIDETDAATLQDLVLSGAVSYAALAAIADRFLPETHDTRRWLNERRAF